MIRRLVAWCTRSRLAPAIRAELHLYLAESGELKAFGSLLAPTDDRAAVHLALLQGHLAYLSRQGASLDMQINGRPVPLVRPAPTGPLG